VAAAVAPRRLVLLSPVDALRRPVATARARREYEWTSRVYAAAGAGPGFQIDPERFEL
jgi:hypothetical protein